mmetsp:Transcript_84632/g.248150  ORF Transcript_84632/g.248150 Transcript_84632/m.248150 type:complete len:102 (-) Transcript_84632:19-324(-)
MPGKYLHEEHRLYMRIHEGRLKTSATTAHTPQLRDRKQVHEISTSWECLYNERRARSVIIGLMARSMTHKSRHRCMETPGVGFGTNYMALAKPGLRRPPAS